MTETLKPIDVLKELLVDDGGCDGYFGSPHFKKGYDALNVWTSPGGKVKMAKILLPMLSPKHDIYTEVFAGSASIFMRKPRVETEVLNDYNEEIATAFSTVQKLTDSEIGLVSKMSWVGDRSTFHKLEALQSKDLGKCERLYRWLYINRFSFGNMVTSGFMTNSQGTVSGGWKRLGRARDRLKNALIYSGDYAEPLVRHDSAEALHYLDPPYPGYKVRLLEKEFDEDRFYKVVMALKGNFLITYGVKGKFPMMIRDDKERFRLKRIYPRSSYSGAGNMGTMSRLGHLLISSYDIAKKSVGFFDDADYAIQDWEDGADRIYEAAEGGSLYAKVDFRPSADMATIAVAGLEELRKAEATDVDQMPLIRKIVSQRAMTPNEVVAAVNFFSMANPDCANTARALGGDAGRVWITKTFAAMCDAEQMCGRTFYDVGGLAMPGAPIVVKRDCVVLTKAGNAIAFEVPDDIEGLIQQSVPAPGAILKNNLIDGHRAIAHTPLYDLVLVPSQDFGHPRELRRMLGSFSYHVGDTGVVSVQKWEKNGGSGTKLMFHRRGLHPDDHWEGGTLIADHEELCKQEPTWFQLIMSVTRAVGAPDWEDTIVRGDMRYFNAFQHKDVVAVKSAEAVGRQVEVCSWCAGAQEDDFREFYFDGDALAGRCVFMKLPLQTKLSKAVWSTAFVNDLPDSSFLWIAPGGKKDAGGKTKPRSLRFFPHKNQDGKIDLPHVRNAIARIPQAKHPAFTSDKKEKLQDKARRLLAQKVKKITRDEMTWVLHRFAESDSQFGELFAKRVDENSGFVILKKDVEKRIVLGPVLVPEQTDLQDDIIDSDPIEEAAHDFLAGINDSRELGVMHNDFSRKMQVVESYITPVDFEIAGRKIIKGTWMLAVRILDDDTWSDVKKGVLRGFSIGGVARNSQKLGEDD